jgi:lipopolysaccharide export system permease protein
LAHKPPPLPLPKVAAAHGPAIPPPPVTHYTPPSPAMMTLTSLTGSVEAASLREQEGQRNIDLYDVEIQKKFAIAVACVIFVFLGAPIALRFPRGGVGMVLGVSLGVFALYYVGLIAGEPLGQRHTVPPWLAMWSSNIVFSIVGALLMLRIGRESSTSRGGDFGELLDKLRRRLGTFIRGVNWPILGRTRSA